MKHRFLALPVIVAASVLALSGCSAPEPDIDAQRAEMLPLVTALADLIYVDAPPEDEIFDATRWCEPREGETRMTRERYSEFWQSEYGDESFALAPDATDVDALFDEFGIEPTVDVESRPPANAQDEAQKYSYTYDFPDGGKVRLRFTLTDEAAWFTLDAATQCSTRPAAP